MIKALLTIEYYLPGYKAGGQLRMVANMVEQLGDQIEFWILTRDRDFTSSTHYPNVKIDAWNRVGKARVYYASPALLSMRNIFKLRKLVGKVAPDVLYLTSFFSLITVRSLLLRRLGLLKMPVILAPQGELSPGALMFKANKKKLYLDAVRKLGLYRKLIWKASSSIEEEEIKRVGGRRCKVVVAPDIPGSIRAEEVYSIHKPTKAPGEVRLVFLSRISPKKNLIGALEFVHNLSGQVVLDIYGPIEDEGYWGQCQAKIVQMSSKVQVSYCGPIYPTEVRGKLLDYHFFLLPTFGENFGHVIPEALAAGCPVLISDRTPWLRLADKKVGWDLPLENAEVWQRVLQRCVNMDDATYSEWSQAARRFAVDWASSPSLESNNLAVFTTAWDHRSQR